MKLRTLKNLEGEHDSDIMVDPDVLRQEAIKWIKQERLQRGIGKSSHMLSWPMFMKFFNLTEEDLK